MAVLAVTGPLQADVTLTFSGPNVFSWEVSHIPDLDQRRFMLPGNGGWYCVPAAAMDLITYMANHGPAWLAPGSGNYQSQALYGQAGTAILNLGAMMGTQTPGGTSADNLEVGLNQWLPSTLFATSHDLITPTRTPGFYSVANNVFAGGLVMVGLGFYEDLGDTIKRRGGHLVVTSAGLASEDGFGIAFRDPWTTDSLAVQSTFQNDLYILSEDIVTLDGTPEPRPMWRVNTYTANDGEWQGYIDEVHAIYPMFALIDTEDFGITPALVRSDVVQAAGVPYVQEFPPVAGREIVDLTLHADLTRVIAILEPTGGGPREIWSLSPSGGGQWTQLDIDAFEPSALLVSRHHTLFVIDGLGTILRINIDADPPVTEMIMSSPVPGEALAYDDDNDLLLVYSASEGKLMELNHSLKGPATTQTLPGIPFASEGCVTWDPETGDRWFCVEDQVFRLSEDGGTFEQIILDSTACAIDFGDGGRLYTTDGDELHEYEYIDGKWMYPPDPVFPGYPAGTMVHVSRSSSNFDPALHTGPAWDHLQLEPGDQGGTPIPDCVADIDGDGIVSFSDLIAVLAAWGSSDWLTDVDADLTVGFGDLLIVLAAWGPCPDGGLP